MKRILVVHKKSEFEGLPFRDFSALPSHQKEAVEAEFKNNKMAKAKLDGLLDASTGLGYEVSNIDTAPTYPDTNAYDLIITLGGDGTFLRAAKQYPDSFLLGINSDPHHNPKRGSIGALTSMDYTQMEVMLPKILNALHSDVLTIEDWPVLSVELNGKLLDHIAINELALVPKLAHQTCDFTLELEDERETFNSSGLLVATGMGSNAWFRNAGATPFSNKLQAMGLIVLDPNLKRNPSFTQKIVPSNDSVKITVHRNGYWIYFDSGPECEVLKLNDVIEVRHLKSIKVVKV